MLHKIRLTPKQVDALYDLAYVGDDAADVLLDDLGDGMLLVGQGDERAVIHPNGRTEVES